MASFEDDLQKWIVNETSFLSEHSLKNIPDVFTLSHLYESKNKKIFDYILTHVRSKCTVQKVKRILKLKRDQNNLEKLFPKPAIDFSKLHNEITKLEEKQSFLKSSLSVIKKEIISTEDAIQNICRETDEIYQKTAISQLKILHYQEKTAFLNSLYSRLSFHLSDKNYKQTTKCLPLNFEASAKKIYSATPDKINFKIKHLLTQTESLVTKKFRNSLYNTLSFVNLQKSITETLKSTLMCDLLLILKEQSKISHVNMIKRLTLDQRAFATVSKDLAKRDSEKLLQTLKFTYVDVKFSVKKVKNEISELINAKNLLIMSKMNHFSEDVEYQTKCQLLNKIAENISLQESISFLEEMLSNEQTKVNILKRTNAAEAIVSDDILTIQNKFYNEFDTMCLLQNSLPAMLDYIVKYYTEIHKYVNEELFLIVSAVMQEFPHELENELKFENEALWNILRKNDVIQSMLQGSQTFEQTVPDAFLNMVNVTSFQNLADVCRNMKLLKDYTISSEKDDWEYDEKRLWNANKQYDNMMNIMQEIESKLNVCEKNLESSLNGRNAIQTALDEWWNQSAQFIPNILYDNKTLKMWIDILNFADGVV